MRPFPILVLLFLVGGQAVRGQGVDAGNPIERVFAGLEREWGNAIVSHDAAAMERILAKEYVLTTPEGQVVTRSQVIESLRTPLGDEPFTIMGVAFEDLAARVYGDVAVVSSRFVLKVKADGRDVETPFRHTDVFVKRDHRWRCIARQATRIVPGLGTQTGTAAGRGNGNSSRRSSRAPRSAMMLPGFGHPRVAAKSRFA